MMSRCRVLSVISCVSLLICCGWLRAQDSVPTPDGPAVSVDAFTAEEPTAYVVQHGSNSGNGYHVKPRAYYSPTLRGWFRAEWMFIHQGGTHKNFWGARVMHLDYDSPVRQLGLASGDVITRLDGLSIANGMFRQGGGPWQIVELDNHFGRTEVRFIHRGSNQVRLGDMMLDGTISGDYPELSPVAP
jgi:hypothetical protein